MKCYVVIKINDGKKYYWTLDKRPMNFELDIKNACRFVRRQDAVAYIALHIDGLGCSVEEVEEVEA